MAADLADGVVREGIVADGVGEREGRAYPIRCPAWNVRGLRLIGGEERMVVVDRKWGETSPSKPIRGSEWSHSLRGRQGCGGRVRFLAKKVPYQARKVQTTKEQKKQNRKRRAMEL